MYFLLFFLKEKQKTKNEVFNIWRLKWGQDVEMEAVALTDSLQSKVFHRAVCILYP